MEDPTEMGDNAISSEDEGGREVATSVEHHEPATASAGGGHEAKWHGDVPMLRKHAASSDAVGEREAKQTWS